MDRHPELLRKAATETRNIVLNDSHLMRLAGLQDVTQGYLERTLLNGARLFRIFRERFEDVAAHNILPGSRGHREIAVARGDDMKIGIEHQIWLRHPAEDGGEIDGCVRH